MDIEEWEGLLNSRIISAYAAGMSVVEITRAIRKQQVSHVHNLLRETGAITGMARSDYRRTYQIDPRLTAALRALGYSFGRWCLGWRLAPEPTVLALRSAPDSASHEAVRRDFPEVYYRIYGGNKPLRKNRATAAINAHASLNISWEQERGGYVARVQDCPEVEAVGSDWCEAAETAQAAFRCHRYLQRLDVALDVCNRSCC